MAAGFQAYMLMPAAANFFLNCTNLSIETEVRQAASAFAFLSCSAISSAVGSGLGPEGKGPFLGSIVVCGAPANASPVLPISSIALTLLSIQYLMMLSA